MRILVVEDEARIADYLKKGFTESGYQVEVAKDGLEGRYLLEESVFDLVTLDIMLPGLNGWQLLQFIRSQGDTPVICLSAQDAVEDKVRGLEQGADDYLAKPFSFAELLARARKLLRRGKAAEPVFYQLADLQLDPLARRVSRRGQRIDLTNKEFTLLQLLLGCMAFYLYFSLERELAWRDDQSLLGRLEHMQALLTSSDSITDLQDRPTLYANMLGNEDSLLWVLNLDGEVLISVNPAGLAVPAGLSSGQTRLGYNEEGNARLAWRRLEQQNTGLMLVAGKLLSPREQMLAAYRLRLLLALAGGALIAFLLGWLVSRRGLKPVRRLATEAGAIEVRRLHRRLNTQQLPEELGELGKSLNHMLARLEDGFGRLSRFSEDLAHEIRTPLSNLMGHTEHALRQARSREEYESLLASHLEEYQRLSRMINSMLFLARSEQPQAGIQPEAVALTPLMEQLCDYFEGMAEEAGTTLINQAHGEVWADAELLRWASPLPSAASTAAMAWRSACTTADRSLPESIYPACLIAFTAATRPALRAAIPAAWGWPLSTPLCSCTVVK